MTEKNLHDIVKAYRLIDPKITIEHIVQYEKERGNILIPETVKTEMFMLYTPTPENIKSFKCSLQDVHEAFNKWFKIEDMNRIDIVLAAALSKKLKGIPIWLILVAPSGDMKTEQLTAIDDDEKLLMSKMIPRFTDKTLVNGNKDKSKYPDLAPKLDDRIMIITDMAEILQLRIEVKSQIWAQLRNLYDGFAGMQSGAGADIQYRNLKVTMLAASTPAIDEQILIHQSLGTRELVYRPKQIINIEELMQKVWDNEECEDQMKKELKFVCLSYLYHKNIDNIEISEFAKFKIKELSQYLAIMRAAAPSDQSGDLRGFIHPEKPTRILKQLKRLFICLMNLDAEYTEEKALEIIKETVFSSMDQMRHNVLSILIKNERRMTTSEIAEILKIGKKTAKTELSILWHLGLIDHYSVENTSPSGYNYVIQEEWWINENNELIKKIKQDIYSIE